MSILSFKMYALVLFGGISSLLSSGVYAEDGVNAGNVSVGWKIDGLPVDSPETARLTNLTFRFNVGESTLHQSGTYFAQQFFFDNTGSSDGIAYLGLQPRKDKKGQSYLRAVFSSFIEGTKSDDANCSDGADDGPGVSCGVEFPATYGQTYEITVFKTGDHSWGGEVRNTETDKTIPIGSWSLPETTSDLKPVGNGFAEYYYFYKPGYPQFVVPDCSELAKIHVFYGPVTTTDFGGAIGSITQDGEYGSEACNKETSGYSAQTQQMSVTMADGEIFTADGVEIERGFVSRLPD